MIRGQIRVGRCTYDRSGKRTDPSYPGFTPILILTKSSPYASLSPYELKDEKGRIMENIYQSSKTYRDVPYSKQKYSRYDHRVIWEHPAETHARLVNGVWQITPEYIYWRHKLSYCPEAVRYPVGYNHRGACLFAMAENEDGTINPTMLDYVQGRKKIYCPVYTKLVKQQKQFHELKQRLNNGESLLICEVDGPHQEALSYYQQTYGVNGDFIENNTMIANEANLQIMLNDTKHPYGHCYCAAAALLDIPLL